MTVHHLLLNADLTVAFHRRDAGALPVNDRDHRGMGPVSRPPAALGLKAATAPRLSHPGTRPGRPSLGLFAQ